MGWMPSCAPIRTLLIGLLGWALLAGNVSAQPMADGRLSGKPQQNDAKTRPVPLFPVGLVTLKRPQQHKEELEPWMQASLQSLARQEGCADGQKPDRLNPFAETYFDRAGLQGTRWAESNRRLILAFISQDGQMLQEFVQYARTRPGAEGYVLALSAGSFASRLPPQERQWLADLVRWIGSRKHDAHSKTAADEMLLRHVSGEAARRRNFVQGEGAAYNFNLAALTLLDSIATQRGMHGSRTSCVRHFNALMNGVYQLVRLNACPKMIAHLENFIYRSMPQPDGFMHVVMRTYAAVMAGKPQLAEELVRKLATARADGISCRGYIQSSMQKFVEMARSP